MAIKNTELDGMIHYKDLSWPGKDLELEKYRKNQIVKFKILEINQENEKIRRYYSRSCPEPKTMNFEQVKSSRPMGPRACIRVVLIPISAPRPN